MAAGPPQELPLGTGDLESCWGPWASRPALLQPQPACPYAALPCYGVLPPPPLALYAPPVPAAYALPGGPPLLWPRAAFCSPPGRLGTADDPPRAKASASRESAAALKAWLGRHRKHPYPSKGEKVLLAVLSSMTLTQVSTWFANARRRLKKESRARWGPRLPPAEGGEEEEEGEGEAEGGGGTEAAGPAAAASAPRLGTRPPPGAAVLPPKPKIWSVAELAVGCRPAGAAL